MLEKWRLKTKTKLNAQQDIPKISVMDGVLPIMVLNEVTTKANTTVGKLQRALALTHLHDYTQALGLVDQLPPS